MVPMFFGGYNVVYQPPTNWRREMGDCGPLPVRRDEHGLTSVWKPSAEELAQLNAGGGIVVRVGVKQQPVMSMGTCEAACLMVSA